MPSSKPASDEIIPNTIKHGLEKVALGTAAGLVVGGLASVVLARGGGRYVNLCMCHVCSLYIELASKFVNDYQ